MRESGGKWMLAPGTRIAVGRWWRAFPSRIKACGGYKGQVEAVDRVGEGR